MLPMRSRRPGRGPGRGRAGRTRAIVIATATATALVALAAPAWAHITVTPGTAQPGSATELTFRVPNEEAKANVTQVQLQIPTDHPIAQLLAKPVPGWTIAVKSCEEAIQYRKGTGTDTTHWRVGTQGMTCSTR